MWFWISLTSSVLAAQPDVYVEWVQHVPVLETDTIDPDWFDARLEEASGRAPAGAPVQLWGPGRDGRLINLSTRLPELPPVPDKEPWAGTQRSAMPADHPGESAGALSGKAIYLSQCHGWQWSETLGRWATQRGNVWDTVEDFHNPEGMNQYLTAYLENAGAKVYTVKERDISTRGAIADNDGGGYAESGSGFGNGAAGFAERSTYGYGEDPFDSGTTRTFPADGGGVATWTPQVPEDGYYNVYVAWDSDPGNASDAHYRITHPGGTIDRYYDQTVHGSTWQYVERLYLTAGSSLTVELVGDSSESGRTLSADAVRIGGGMGIIMRNGETSERPRWESAGIYGAQYNGAPTSVYDPINDGDGSDPSSRSRWADWEHPSGEDAIYLSWHSNASSGGARGTVTYFAGGGPDAPSGHGSECSVPAIEGSYSLSRAVQDELIDQFTSNWESGWSDRGVNQACFAEVNPSYNDEMPATLVELAFHDNEVDASFIRHPQFRRDSAKAMYRGIVRYFAERDGDTVVFAPEPPVEVVAQHNSDGLIELSWKPGATGGTNGDAASSYRVYTSADGKSWDNGFDVNGTSTAINAPYANQYYRVAGVNDGGVSFPSAIVGARRSPAGEAPVLVVDAFDRLDRGLLDLENVKTLGLIYRMDLQRMNTYSVIVPHGEAIGGAEWFFDSATDEALPNLDLSKYRMIVWATGEESSVDESFSTAQQTLLSDYLVGGGTLWASGAEILWDLDALGDAGDQEFAAQVLGATMATDQAGSNVADGEGILAGITNIDFSVEGGAPYPVEWPDGLGTSRPVIARYTSGEVAAIAGEGVAMFGFPFDAIADADTRIDIAAALLPELVPDYEPPIVTDPDPDPLDTGDLDTADPAGANDARVPLDEMKGCGCQHTGGLGAGMLLPLGLLAMVRRRRKD